jgi:hypothetical protein
LATKLFKNENVKKHAGNFFPLHFLKILCIFRIFANKKWQPEKRSDFKDLGHFVSRTDHIMG